MGNVHRFVGQDNTLDWEGQKIVSYGEADGAKRASLRWILGPFKRSPHFALRYVQIEPGGWSSLDQHVHDHGVFVLRGRGRVRHGEEESDIAYGDVVYIPSNEPHQFINTGHEPFGFLCIIPQKRLLRELKAVELSPDEEE